MLLTSDSFEHVLDISDHSWNRICPVVLPTFKREHPVLLNDKLILLIGTKF